MDVREPHRFDVSIKEAKEIQDRLRRRVLLEAPKRDFRLVAGVDAGFPGPRTCRSGGKGNARAGVVLIDTLTMNTVEEAVAEDACRFPYIPGYLSFREGPVILKAFRKLKNLPDLGVFDAQGIAHPRGLGLASHLGVILDIPSIGCAKSRLVGEYREPAKKRGSISNLHFEGKEVGKVLRTRDGVKPVFVSPGHRMDCEAAARIILTLAVKYRLPEPTRRAHILVSCR